MSLFTAINAMGYENYDALHPIVKKLKKKEIDAVDEYGDTALHIAASKLWPTVVRKLLSHKATVDIRNAQGLTPLQLVFTLPSIDQDALIQTVKELLDKHADPNVKNANGDTPLHLALKKNFHEAALCLLARRANPNQQNNMGRTSLHLAVMHGTTNLINSFITNGARNIADKQLHTPLHLACVFGDQAIIQAMLDRDEIKHNLNSPDLNNETPLYMYINRNERYSLNETPKKYQHDQWIEIFRKVIECNDEVVLELLCTFDTKFDMDSKILNEIDKEELFYQACSENRRLSVTIFLRTYKLNVNFRIPNTNDTPLCAALGSGHLDLAFILLDEGGADINLDGENEDSPLHCYVVHSDAEGIKRLLLKGASVDSKNKQQLTPIAYARNSEVIQLLVEHGATVSIENVSYLYEGDYPGKKEMIQTMQQAIIRSWMINKHFHRTYNIPKTFRHDNLDHYEMLCDAEWIQFKRAQFKGFQLIDLIEDRIEAFQNFKKRDDLEKYLDSEGFKHAYPELWRLAKSRFWRLKRRLVVIPPSDSTQSLAGACRKLVRRYTGLSLSNQI